METEFADEGPTDLIGLIASTSGLLRRWLDRQAEAEWGLSGPRAALMMMLGSEGAATMSELARRLSVTPRAITRLVDGLAQDGYVERLPDEHDGRVTWVQCTPSAQMGVEAAGQFHAAQVTELLGDISRTDLEVTLRTLAELRSRLRLELGLEPGESVMPPPSID